MFAKIILEIYNAFWWENLKFTDVSKIIYY